MAIPTILIVEEPERDLYGRVKEKAAISVAYDQCMDLATAMRGSEKSHVILVHGPSGSGKTALLQHVFEERIRQEGGFFIYGKFDSVPSARPWPAIVDAFSDLCVQCLASERRSKIRKALCEELESDVNQLSHLIPNFKALVDGFLGSDDDTEENGDWNDIQASFRRNEFGFTRIKLLFQRFLRAICHPISSPIVLLLDDVQWADQSSLLLIEALLSEGEPVSGFLLAITSDEPGLFRRAQVNRDLVNATKIRIRNLSKNDWIEMTKQTLKKAKSYIAAEELDILFKKTMGNPFLTVLCVKAIDEGGLLKELEIEADNGVKAGILSVIKGRLSRLAKPAQDALFLGACFGLRFCMDWVAPLVPTYGSTRNASLQPDVMPLNWGSGRLDDSEHLSESELKETLNEAIVNGLVTKRCGIPWYEFTHHSIRDAAYDLFRNSSCKRERIHLLIGEHTLRKVRFSSSSEDDTILWTAVDHLNLGSSQLHEERKLIELARLNGRAAEKSMLKLAFFSAAQYASAGLEKIGRVGGWQTDFAVTWELSTHLCRMYSCLGEHEACKRVANDVVSRSSSIFEKLGAFEAVMESSRVEGNVEEAFNIGFDVLRSLNEPFPNRVSKALLIWEIVKTKRILTRKTLKDLSGLPKMADERACATVRFLKLLSLTFFAMGNYFSYFVASLRIVRLSTKYGVARESPKAFVVFGNILSQTSRHFNEASRYMSVALSLGEKAGKSGRAQSLAVGSWILTPLQGTVSEAVGQALYGYRLAMECGEVVCACTSVLSYCGLYFWSGLPIPPLMKDLPTFLTMLSEYKQTVHEVGLSSLMYFIQTLTAETNPTDLYDDTVWMVRCQNAGAAIQVNTICLYRIIYAYYMQDLSSIRASQLDAHRAAKVQLSRTLQGVVCWLFVGLSDFFLAQAGCGIEFQRSGQKILRMMRRLVVKGDSKCEHMFMFLRAEKYKLVSKQSSEVLKSYDEAISGAGQAGFFNHAALANERAALYCLARGKEKKAAQYFQEAWQGYLNWGAHSKVDQLGGWYSAYIQQSSRK